MELVRIKTNQPLNYSYVDEDGKRVTLVLDEGDQADIPALDAGKLHEKGYVKVAASQAEVIQNLNETQQPTQPVEQPTEQTDTNVANG